MDRAIKILFLAANPQDTSRLRIDEEIRGIKQTLLQSEFRDKFDIEQEWAVRVTDLQSYLLRHEPDIVHFSGHGGASSEIMLEDNNGNSQSVSSRALSQLFSVLKGNIRCVVLNACYSEQQAQAIAEHIECVIGMSKALGDPAAINFAVAFYQALGYGRDVKTAFDCGCLQIDLENLDEKDTPKLKALNADPQNIVFAIHKITMGAKNTSPFWLERFVYLSIIIPCLILFVISSIMTLITDESSASKITSMIGSGGIMTVMTGRFLNMRERESKLL